MISPLLPPVLVGAITFVVLLASLVFSFAMLLPGILLKLLPWPPTRNAARRWCLGVARQWASTNQILYRMIHAEQWQVEFRQTPRRDGNYLLVCNHQSVIDILVLFDVLHGRVPLPRFFMKQQLIYAPIIGAACWAMDFPFMKRHSREAVAANPALRGEDLATTRRACEIFRTEPVTVVNFVEGTRFSEAKRVQGDSPYRHLLRPKAGGLSFTLNAMGEQFAGILDVTIAYRPARNIFWSWLCGEQNTMALHFDVVPIPPELVAGDYEGDPAFRARVQGFVNTLWARKDARLARLLNQPQLPAQQRPAHG